MAEIVQGHYKGLESYTEEYKVFCLDNLELYFTDDEIRNFLLYNIKLNCSKFNLMVRANLYNLMNKYLPKYIGNFSKAGIDGKFYIGITDDGIIEGIPWYGNLTKKMIKKIINDVLESGNSRGVKYDESTKTIIYDDSVVDWYYSNLEVNVYTLKIDPLLIEEQYIKSLKKLQLLIMKNKHIEKEWEEYDIIYKRWHIESSAYSGKLNNYIKNDKLFAEVINFIREQITDKKILDQILDFYKDKSNFNEFVLNNEKKIKSMYDDPNNPIIWIVRYKDSMCGKFKKLKPQKPQRRPIHNILNIYANHISNIKAHLTKCEEFQKIFETTNEGSEQLSDKPILEYKFLEIIIRSKTNTHTQYRKSIVTDWISKERIVDKTGPTCI